MSGEPPDEDPWLIDFFEEDETHENASAKPGGLAARRQAALARRRGATGEGRLRAARLAVAVLAILVVAVIAIVSLGGGSEAGSDRAYLTKVGLPAAGSQAVGAALTSLLRSAPSSSPRFEASLRRLLARQQQALGETSALSAPPLLRDERQQAIAAMQFRTGALSGLLSGFQEAVAHPAGTDWASQLSILAERLIASDVIWRDFFVTPADAQAAHDGDHDASLAPASTFVTDANLTAPTAMAAVLSALQGHAASRPGSQSAVLKLGSKGASVLAWQRDLNSWIARQSGLHALKLTGVFDQATQTATMALQTAAKIGTDGVVGPMTRAALVAALAQKH